MILILIMYQSQKIHPYHMQKIIIIYINILKINIQNYIFKHNIDYQHTY